MSSDDVIISFSTLICVMLATAVSSMGIGIAIGQYETEKRWICMCENAGVKIVEHEMKTDGLVTTNWFECVSLKR